MTVTLRLDLLVGREVHTANNRRLGRLYEFRAEHRGSTWIVTDYVIGTARLMERLGLGIRLLLGLGRPAGYVVRWDQVDFSDPDRPKLRCPVSELRRQ
jgi:hypothetical protein